MHKVTALVMPVAKPESWLWCHPLPTPTPEVSSRNKQFGESLHLTCHSCSLWVCCSLCCLWYKSEVWGLVPEAGVPSSVRIYIQMSEVDHCFRQSTSVLYLILGNYKCFWLFQVSVLCVPFWPDVRIRSYDKCLDSWKTWVYTKQVRKKQAIKGRNTDRHSGLRNFSKACS